HTPPIASSPLSLHDALPISEAKFSAPGLDHLLKGRHGRFMIEVRVRFREAAVDSAYSPETVFQGGVQGIEGGIRPSVDDGRSVQGRKSTRLNSSHVKIPSAV